MLSESGPGRVESLEQRRLLSGGPVSITIASGQTYQLTSDITDFTSLSIQGSGPDSILDGNGFQIINSNLADDVTISNVRIKNLGKNWIDPSTGTFVPSDKNYAIDLTALFPSSAHITIEDTVFDASSSVYIWNGPGSTSTLQRNVVLSNSLAPGGVTPALSAPFLTVRGPSTEPKDFSDNRIYESFVQLDYAQNWSIHDNVLAGDRAGFNISGSTGIQLFRNYIHTLHDYSSTNLENPYGSQVSSLQMLDSIGISTHDNVFRDSGLAMIRGLFGDFSNNVLLDLLGGDWIINPGTATSIHHNIFVGRYDGVQVNLASGIRLYDPGVTGVSVYNNTFDGGPNFASAPIDIEQGATLDRLSNNIFTRFPISWPWGNAIVRPGLFETFSGSPARPSVDQDRLGYANNNDFYNPTAGPGTVNYAVGVAGAAYGTANFGSGDFAGVDPRFASPLPTAFPFSDTDIESGLVTVRKILGFYRSAYSLSSSSPLVGRNIGAVPLQYDRARLLAVVDAPPIGGMSILATTFTSGSTSGFGPISSSTGTAARMVLGQQSDDALVGL